MFCFLYDFQFCESWILMDFQTFLPDGQTLQSEMIFKVQNWVILDYVEAGGSYHLQLYTLYGEEPKNSIKSVASNFSFSTRKLTDQLAFFLFKKHS